jgi:hypothetical protein
MSINTGRVVLGGVVGGVVANACDFVANAFFLADDMQQMAQRLGLDQTVINGSTVLATWTIVDFLYATLIVWTYAAIRPRFGPGPSTAIVAALAIFSGVTLVLFGFAQMGIFTIATFVKATLLSAITAVLTGLAGATVYREG